MAKRPRRRGTGPSGGVPDLNLAPMMNLFASLIPIMLLMTAMVEICMLNVAAPTISDSSDSPPPDKPPLNLTVIISDEGYTILGAGGVMMGDDAAPSASADPSKPSLPLVEKEVSCSRYRGIKPPPRKRNEDLPPCQDGDDKRHFWSYDREGFTRKIIQIKDAFPSENRIIIQAQPHIEYEAIIDVMDAARDVVDGDNQIRVLFDEVVLSPGLA